MIELFSFSTALFLSLVLTPLMIRCANKFNIIDTPKGDLKKHDAPTPYLGGIAIWAALAVSSILFLGLTSWLALFLAGTGFLCITGLIDDIYCLAPSTKFILQTAGCVTLLISLTAITGITPPAYMLALNLFFLFTIVNAVNLVDIMDALAGTTALISMLGFIALAIIDSNSTALLLGTAVTGAIMGFLWYNKRPAKIYLGDAGSLTIGGILGFFALLYGWGTTLGANYFVGPCITGIVLIELIYLIIIRSYLKIPVYLGSPHHFAIYLKKLGWSWGAIIFFVATSGLILNGLVIASALGTISITQLFAVLFASLIPWTLIIYRKPI